MKETLDQAGLDNKPVTPSTLPIAPISRSSGAAPDLKPNLTGN